MAANRRCIKILAGVYQPTEGQILLDGRSRS
jgi:ABC-type sugar transport system ATPase subunit